jgi:hypothetical protein
VNEDNEVHRVRDAMSTEAGHDIRVLIARINERKPSSASRIIDPGAQAEKCGVSVAGVLSEPAKSATE